MLTIIGIFLAICAFCKAIYIGSDMAYPKKEYIFGPSIDPILHVFLCLGFFLSSLYLLSK